MAHRFDPSHRADVREVLAQGRENGVETLGMATKQDPPGPLEIVGQESRLGMGGAKRFFQEDVAASVQASPGHRFVGGRRHGHDRALGPEVFQHPGQIGSLWHGGGHAIQRGKGVDDSSERPGRTPPQGSQMMASHAPQTHQDHERRSWLARRPGKSHTGRITPKEPAMATSAKSAAPIARKPVKNFIFHPKIQVPQLISSMLLAASTALGTGIAILFVYHREFGESAIYIMDRDSTLFPLDRQGLLQLLLPAVGGTAFAGMLLGWILSLGASRRIALPIYKIQHWAHRISEGDLLARVVFRKADKLDELANACNTALDHVREGYDEIRTLAADEKIPKEVRDRLVEILSRCRREEA